MLKGAADSLLCEVFKLRLPVLQRVLSVKLQTASLTGGNSLTSPLQEVKLTGFVPSDLKTYEIENAR